MFDVFCCFTACPVKEGMSSPQDIPEKNLAASPENAEVQNVRPGKNGKYVEKADKQPTITVTLVADEKDAPVPIGVIKVTGNTPGFQVLYKPSDDEEFKPVTKQGSEEPKVRIAVDLGNCCKKISTLFFSPIRSLMRRTMKADSLLNSLSWPRRSPLCQ
jgi:hypothetical protein